MDNKEYKKTFKNTLAFGGVQIFNVLISVIRGKFIAVLLGPVGIGINSLLTSAITLISTLTSFGLELSAVREISETTALEDRKLISKKIGLVNKLFLLTGLFGLVLTIILSPLLSKWSFHSYDYTLSFVFLSLMLFFTALSKGQSTILRGLRKVNTIIKSGLYASIIGLFTSIPIFYFFGSKGIVPSLILTAASGLIINWFYIRRLDIHPTPVTLSEVYSEGLSMTKLGFMLVIASLIGNLTQFLINISIGKIGSLEDIGFYTAAIAISGQYIGFVLTSLSADYFPRLAAVNQDTLKLNVVVNEQSEIVLLLATPLLIFMLISAPLLVSLLLSSKFSLIIGFIRFIAVGSFFQAASFCLGYISFAKNDKKTYLILEGVIGNALRYFSTIVCYYLWGLNGLGISFLLCYLIYFVLIYFVTSFRYTFMASKPLKFLFLRMLLLITLCFIVFLFFNNWIGYVSGSIILIISIHFSFVELEKRLSIKSLVTLKIADIKNRINNKN